MTIRVWRDLPWPGARKDVVSSKTLRAWQGLSDTMFNFLSGGSFSANNGGGHFAAIFNGGHFAAIYSGGHFAAIYSTPWTCAK